MTVFTLIGKDNKVFQFDYVSEVNNVDDAIIIGNTGEIIVNKGNPITWPADASDGLQAIVDVKEGTLRFAHGWWSWAVSEFVVSEYVAPVKKGLHSETIVVEWPEDAPDGLRLIHNLNTLTSKFESPRYVLKQDEVVGAVKGMCSVPPVTSSPHIFDVINYWPQQDRQCLGTKDLPEGWMWQWAGNDWVLSNGVFGLVRDDWFKYRNKMVEAQQVSAQPTQVTAASMLTAALGHMEDRAKTYDAPGGERSMGKTVAAFNVITGHNLTEEAGWLFMEILKQVRSQQGDYRADNYEDMVAYAALRGECAARERGNK